MGKFPGRRWELNWVLACGYHLKKERKERKDGISKGITQQSFTQHILQIYSCPRHRKRRLSAQQMFLHIHYKASTVLGARGTKTSKTDPGLEDLVNKGKRLSAKVQQLL